MRFININKQQQSNDINDYAVLKEHPKKFPYYVLVTENRFKNLIASVIGWNTLRSYEDYLLVDFQECSGKTFDDIKMLLHDGGSLRSKLDGKHTKRFIKIGNLIPIKRVKNIINKNNVKRIKLKPL